jgi:hypothetical protein
MRALLIAEKPSLKDTIQKVYNKYRNVLPDSIDFACFHGHIVGLVEPRDYGIEAWTGTWNWEMLPINPQKFKTYPTDKKTVQDLRNKIENGNLLYITEEQVEEKLDVKPELVRYYRPFRGDSSDNISSAATRVQSKYLKPVAESIRTNLLQGNTLDMAYDKAVVQHIATLSANALSTIQSGKSTYLRNFCLMDLLKYNKNPLEISYVSLPALNQSGFLEILNKYQMNEFKKYYFETLSALGVGNALQD